MEGDILKLVDTERLVQELEQRRQQHDGPIVTSSTVVRGIKNEAYVSIFEQPKQRGLRFRYKCEGRSAGSIPGDKSTSERKTYPAIQIHNFEGPAAIVVVSCVTKEKPYQPHPHNLVGPDCRDGVCTVKIKGNHIVTFPNVGIQCCKRHDVEESLKNREKIRVDPFGTGYPATSAINNLDLNAVRLCFQVFLPDNSKKFTVIVPPIVSQPIIDKKSIHDLIICRLSRNTGCALGQDEVFLLCEKINKDDIQVRFYQELDDGLIWEAYGDFTPNDVHRQFAIVFRTPPYVNPHIEEAVTVYMQLKRPSDDEFGDPKPFTYIPQDPDPFDVQKKRIRRDFSYNMNTHSQIPMHVQQQDESEYNEPSSSVSLDVKSKLKRKAERGLSQRDAMIDLKPMVNYTDHLMDNSHMEQPKPKPLQASNFLMINTEQLSQFFQQNNFKGILNGSGDNQSASQILDSDLNRFLQDEVSLALTCSPITSGNNIEQISNDLNVGAHEYIQQGSEE